MIVLKAPVYFEQHAVLIARRINGRHPLRSVGRKQSTLNLFRTHMQRRRAVAVNLQRHLRALDLQIASDLRQPRNFAQFLLKHLRAAAQLLNVAALQRVLIQTLGHRPANANQRRILQKRAGGVQAIQLRPQPGDHLLYRRLAQAAAGREADRRKSARYWSPPNFLPRWWCRNPPPDRRARCP